MLNSTHILASVTGIIIATLIVSELPPAPPSCGVPPKVEELPFLPLNRSDVDCVGRANCMAEARKAYRLGVHLTEHIEADIANPFLALKHFMRAEELLNRAALKVPEDMRDVASRQTELEAELERSFRQRRANYRAFEDHKLHQHMADELARLKAEFPHPAARHHRWAVDRERDMRDRGIYPSTDRRF